MARSAMLSDPRSLEECHTLDEFISFGSSVERFDYKKFCLIENIDGVDVVVHNVLDDYIEDLRDQAILIELTPKQIDEFKYNPKKLSWRLYGTTILYHLILKLNNLASTHEFTLKSGQLLLYPPTAMKNIVSTIFKAERNTIMKYNNLHDDDTSNDNQTNDRLGY